MSQIPRGSISRRLTSPDITLIAQLHQKCPSHRESGGICSGPPILNQWFDSWVQLLFFKIFLKNKDHFTTQNFDFLAFLFPQEKKKTRKVSENLSEVFKISLLSPDICPMAYNTTFDGRSAGDRVLFNMLVNERKPTLCISLTPHSITQYKAWSVLPWSRK